MRARFCTGFFMTVFFIGALLPGDPELITVKGQRLIRDCPVIHLRWLPLPAAVLEGIGPNRWSIAPNPNLGRSLA